MTEHSDELRLWLRLLACTGAIERAIRARLRERFGATLPRFDLMAQLDRAPAGLMLGALSQRMMVSNGNVTGLVERLVDQGLIDRAVHPTDRRATVVRLTGEGHRAFAAMAHAHAGWVAELCGALTPAERDTMIRLLGKLKRAGAVEATTRELEDV